MAFGTKLPAGGFNDRRGFRILHMLPARTMACFTPDAAMNIFKFLILNVLVTIEAGILTRKMSFRSGIIYQGITPVMTIFSKGVRDKERPDKQKKGDEDCKGNG